MTTKTKTIILIIACVFAYMYFPQVRVTVDNLISKVAVQTKTPQKKVIYNYSKDTLTYNPRRGRTD